MLYYYNQCHVNSWRIEELKKVIDNIELDLIEYVTKKKIEIARDYKKLLFDSSAKAILTMKEIVLLCSFGYCDGALGLARNLYEQMIIVSFFDLCKKEEIFNEYVEDYFLDMDIRREKLRKLDYENICGNDDILQRIDEGIQELNKLKYSTTKGEYWWARKGSFSCLKDTVVANKDVSLKPYFGMLNVSYKMACATLHAGCEGNSFRLNSKEYGVTSTGTSYEKAGLPLWFATCAIIEIFEIIYIEFEIDYANYGMLLLELQEYYRERI